ncbi:MAG TPA: RsmE family RNA methyltransferase [Candidatus Paceibacterota bacterium]|nr:RsmE family RNA methyltransferase [Candidatus Paceibacterota bacterium]
MRLHRFYTTEKIEGNEIEISEKRIVHQVRNVFRLGVGDKIIVFNGNARDYESEIVAEDKKSLKLKILKETETFVPKKRVTLFMSVIKKENFELVCEKATELGVSEIVPVISERTLMKNLNPERIEKILIEASEQCGRGDIPTLKDARKLTDVLTEENLIVCDMGGEKIENQESEIKILVGPEGGWSEEERKLFKDKNLKIVSLGETVLRAETAAIAALAKMF